MEELLLLKQLPCSRAQTRSDGMLRWTTIDFLFKIRTVDERRERVRMGGADTHVFSSIEHSVEDEVRLVDAGRVPRVQLGTSVS